MTYRTRFLISQTTVLALFFLVLATRDTGAWLAVDALGGFAALYAVWSAAKEMP